MVSFLICFSKLSLGLIESLSSLIFSVKGIISFREKSLGNKNNKAKTIISKYYLGIFIKYYAVVIM